MEPTAELKQAVRKCREGDREAFTQLYEESSKYIYTCIYNTMRGNDNVEDAVCDIMQDTYVEISRNITKLENEDSFLSWAGKTAVRKCYAWLKKNKKYVLLSEEEEPAGESMENTQESVTVPSVEVPPETETIQSSEENMDILMRLNGDTWEEHYARALLSPETRYVALDLHDFDEDGIPELVAEEKSGILSIRSFHDIVNIPFIVCEADSAGYGEKASELIFIIPRTNEDGTDWSSVYVCDNFEMVETIDPSPIVMVDKYTYDVIDSDYNTEVVSYEEGLQRIQAWKEKYRKIEFKPVDQDTVISVIEAHSENWRLDD